MLKARMFICVWERVTVVCWYGKQQMHVHLWKAEVIVKVYIIFVHVWAK